MALEDYQQRVVDEKTQLDERLTSLRNFFSTETFKGLHTDERRRLARQWWVMTEYSSILGERIAAFGATN